MKVYYKEVALKFNGVEKVGDCIVIGATEALMLEHLKNLKKYYYPNYIKVKFASETKTATATKSLIDLFNSPYGVLDWSHYGGKQSACFGVPSNKKNLKEFFE